MQQLIALREKNQRTLERAYHADRAYHNVVNVGSLYDLDTSAQERKEERAFDKAYLYWAMLPADEMNNARKQYKAIHGYSID
jgi:hypothetical protein